MQAVRHAEAVLAGWQERQAAFQSMISMLGLGASKSVCVLQEWSPGFLHLSIMPHWFSNQIMELDFPVLDPRAGMPNMWLKSLAPQGGS